eukprot:600145-Heterocapsa_arctica.AAC.1
MVARRPSDLAAGPTNFALPREAPPPANKSPFGAMAAAVCPAVYLLRPPGTHAPGYKFVRHLLHDAQAL